MKKVLSLFSAWIGLTTASYAQAASEAPTASIWDDPMLTFYVAIGFIFIVVLLVLLVAVYMLQVIKVMTRQAAQEKAKKLGVVYKEEPSVWSKLWSESNDFVPLEKEADIMLDHNYDGIRELDNHHPGGNGYSICPLFLQVCICFSITLATPYHYRFRNMRMK